MAVESAQGELSVEEGQSLLIHQRRVPTVAVRLDGNRSYDDIFTGELARQGIRRGVERAGDATHEMRALQAVAVK